jgi:hypothetical protein
MLSSKLNTHTSQNSIDFFSELSKIMKTTPSTTNTNPPLHALPTNSVNAIINTTNDDNICLISKEPLHPNHITLACNHKFNYIPIYKEVLYQKTKSNTLYEVTKLATNQIKCPYCRSITNKLLPFVPYPSIKNATYIHAPDTQCIPATKCSHTIKKRNGEPNSDAKCNKNALYYQAENLLFCPQHYKKYTDKKSSIVASSNASLVKVKNKEVCSTTFDKPRCIAVLKTGVNIGKPCNSVISIDGSQLCKRHSH